MSQSDTAERILDAAEKLFAQNGYHNTSLRQITGEAKVNLAAVNYHFGSKEALLEEVFKRRLIPLNAIRSQALTRVKNQAAADKKRPDVADVLRGFVEPTVRFCCIDPGCTHFSALVGRTMSDTDATVRKIFLQYILPLFKQLSALLAEALPDVTPQKVFWRLQFAIGATSHTMRLLGKEDGFVEQMHQEVDIEMIIEELLMFVTAGTEAES
jgi:AcrR family transcriptional regulator